MSSPSRVAATYLERTAMSADQTYKRRRKDCDQLLRDIEKALKKYDNEQKGSPGDWTYVGSLNGVRGSLEEALQRLGRR